MYVERRKVFLRILGFEFLILKSIQFGVDSNIGCIGVDFDKGRSWNELIGDEEVWSNQEKFEGITRKWKEFEGVRKSKKGLERIL